MRTESIRTSKQAHELDFIGDHLAIDFVNTVRVVGGEVTDTLQSDDDVKVWLGLAEVPVATKPASWPVGALLDAARRLRAAALKAIEAKKAGSRPPLKAINAFLESSASHGRLVAHSESGLEFRRVYHGDTPEEYLLPVTEAVAKLLAEGDFDLVRRCASERCVLWFYDRTKGHGRRYCTSTGCGNRAKVAAYRSRAREQAGEKAKGSAEAEGSENMVGRPGKGLRERR
jgi:predicted RNA-binding Zn ribbon-like protein